MIECRYYLFALTSVGVLVAREPLVLSYLPSTAGYVGAAAASTESLLRCKYQNVIGNYIFEPFGVETLGSWGPSPSSRYA